MAPSQARSHSGVPKSRSHDLSHRLHHRDVSCSVHGKPHRSPVARSSGLLEGLTESPSAGSRRSEIVTDPRKACAGARIASLVVGRPELFAEWNEEMEYMSGRIKASSTLIPDRVELATPCGGT